MLEITGKKGKAICFAKTIETEAVKQIEAICNSPISEGSRIRIMPDVHAGKGCTIGTTMTITDKVCPNIVGVDIGCGMYVIKLANTDIDFTVLDEVIHTIPSGQNVYENAVSTFPLEKLRCFKELGNIDYILRSIGTLGGGNHFIEVEVSSNGEHYIVIHSGSRYLGKKVAGIYQEKAIEFHKGKDDFLKQKQEIIRTYKEAGRTQQIEQALKDLTKEYNEKSPKLPKDLCYLYGEELEDYLHDIVICQEYAKVNREHIGAYIVSQMGLEVKGSFHTIHNYIDPVRKVLRKGAISAEAEEILLIPLNMKDGSILAMGKGNSDWNYSAPHGAGRLMSRAKAKECIPLDTYKYLMQGVYTTCVNENTLDEAPFAYKKMEDILDCIDEAVDVIDILKPLYNFKASD